MENIFWEMKVNKKSAVLIIPEINYNFFTDIINFLGARLKIPGVVKN